MSDLAPVVGRLPVPGRALWWLGGAVAAGIAIPVIIGAITALLVYYPVGIFLPRFLLLSWPGIVLVIGGSALLVVAVGIGYFIVALNWRPLVLAIIVAAVIVPGVYPGGSAHLYLRKIAFSALADRGVELVEAIKRYERDAGAPPDAIADLVPRYLHKVPHTGMSAYPDYWYSTGPAYWSDANKWSITVCAGSFDVFFYCPKQDYSSRTEMVGHWTYYRD